MEFESPKKEEKEKSTASSIPAAFKKNAEKAMSTPDVKTQSNLSSAPLSSVSSHPTPSGKKGYGEHDFGNAARLLDKKNALKMQGNRAFLHGIVSEREVYDFCSSLIKAAKAEEFRSDVSHNVIRAPKQPPGFNAVNQFSTPHPSAFSRPANLKETSVIPNIPKAPDSPTSKLLLCEEPPKEQVETTISAQIIPNTANSLFQMPDGSIAPASFARKNATTLKEEQLSPIHLNQEAAILEETSKMLNSILSTAQRRYESSAFKSTSA